MTENHFTAPLYGALTLAMLPMVQAQAQQRPNIVFIMTDDHTAQMLSAYDKTNVLTPNLDRIANDGVRFRDCFVSNSISGPSRACMITGKYSHINGFTDNEHSVFDGTQQTMPKLMQKAGYQTAIVGKWHLHSYPTGFDYWQILPGQGDYYNPAFITMKGDTVRHQGYITNLITDMSLDWMSHQRDKQKPFILFIHHKAVHRNWLPELKYLNLYEDVTFPLPHNFYDDYANRKAAQTQEMGIWKHMDIQYDTKMYDAQKGSPLKQHYLGMIGRLNKMERETYDAFYNKLSADFYSRKLTGKALAEWKFQRYMRDYAKVVKSLDDNVGRVLDYLKDEGLDKNTLVVYTSDQGFYMGEHGWFDKRFMYEESMHTPLLMRLPEGFSRKGEITEAVQNIDFAPTFLELAGSPVPADIQGRSMLPLLKGEKPKDWRKAVYYHYYEYPAEHAVKRHYGIRTNQWKLIHFYHDIDTWELYDLQNDPHEMNNLYGKPGYEKTTKQLKKQLKALQKQYKDPIDK